MRPGGGLSVPPALALYALLAVAGILWLELGMRRDSLSLWRTRRPALEVGVGIGTGLAVVLLSRLASRLAPGGRAMEEEFARAIGRPSSWAIPVLALASAVGEELLFRGALQAATGIWIQALVFGACHVPFSKALAGWPVFAGLAGLLFGAMVSWTGTLWAPVLAHAVINQVNLTFLARRS